VRFEEPLGLLREALAHKGPEFSSQSKKRKADEDLNMNTTIQKVLRAVREERAWIKNQQVQLPHVDFTTNSFTELFAANGFRASKKTKLASDAMEDVSSRNIIAPLISQQLRKTRELSVQHNEKRAGNELDSHAPRLDDMFTKVIDRLYNLLNSYGIPLDREQVREDHDLRDLGLDSLLAVDLAMTLEQDFGISLAMEFMCAETVKGLVGCIQLACQKSRKHSV
jgi:acyl carrier protein